MHSVTCVTYSLAAPVPRAAKQCNEKKAADRMTVLALALVACGMVGSARVSNAQQTGIDTSRVIVPGALGTGEFATRAALKTEAAGSGPNAAVASERLANGDFRVGDRIALAVQGEPTLTDTFTVREGEILRVPNIPDVRLHGLIHSELQDSLTRVIATFIKTPVVRATPLVRIAVLGQVGRPGFYAAAADELVTTMFTQAGGLMTNSDLGRTVVRRGTQVLYPAKQLQVAMKQGQTIDQLDLRPGDQIEVGERPQGGAALRVIGVIAAVAGIAASIALIASR